MQRKSDFPADRETAARMGRILSGCAVILALLTSDSCSFSGSGCSTTVTITFNENGLIAEITLSRPVNLPLDKDDASYVMVSCGCFCIGELELVDGWWQFQSGDPGCTIRIQASTGDVECSGEGAG